MEDAVKIFRIPILAAANPHGSAQRPAATPAPVTMLL